MSTLLNPFEVAATSNDGKLYIGFHTSKTLNVLNTMTGKIVVEENLFHIIFRSGKSATLTDSQWGHIHDRVNGSASSGPMGQTLGLLGDAFVVATFSGSPIQDTIVSLVHPGRRGLNSNVTLGRIPSARDVRAWSWQSGNRILAAVWTSNPGKWGRMTFYQIADKGATPLRETFTRNWPKETRIRPQYSSRMDGYFAPQDVDVSTGCAIGFVSDDNKCSIRDLKTGKLQTLSVPEGTRVFANSPVLRVAGRFTLCSYPSRSQGGQLFITGDQRKWHLVGPYQLLALSLDRKRALLRSDSNEVWLCPIDKL